MNEREQLLEDALRNVLNVYCTDSSMWSQARAALYTSQPATVAQKVYWEDYNGALRKSLADCRKPPVAVWCDKVRFEFATALPTPQADKVPAAEVASEKQRKLLELADRIDHEKLWSHPFMEHRDWTQDQRDRLMAGAELRRYADLWKSGRWVVFPPVGPVHFSAGTLDAAYEMAKRDEERKNPTPPAKLPQEAQPVEPLFLLHCGQIDSDGEQGDWDCEADSGQRVDEFAALHPGQTIKLYAAPQPARTGVVPGGELGLIETHPNYVAGFKAGHAAGKARAGAVDMSDYDIRVIYSNFGVRCTDIDVQIARAILAAATTAATGGKEGE